MIGSDLKDKCIACGYAAFVNHIHAELVECSNCGLVRAKEIPSKEELKKLYEKDYFFGMEYFDYIADRKALEHNFKKRIKMLEDYLDTDSRIIEVGCAYGYFLNLIKDKVAWHKGYDVSSEGVEYAAKELGLNATTNNFLNDRTVSANSIDSVFMWDVMEHVDSPGEFIKRSAELLRNGGIISLTTGDISALVPKLRGKKWRMIHPPTHLYYFTAHSIELLLQKHGFRVIKIDYRPTYRNVGSVFNQLIINRKAKGKNQKMLKSGYLLASKLHADKLNIPLNLLDVMEVTAQKIK